MTRLRPIALPVLLLGVAASLAAQSPRARRWEVSWTVGGSMGRAAKGIEAGMEAGGLNETDPGGCFFSLCSGPIPHPSSVPGGPTWTLAVTWAIRPQILIRGQWATADLGSTYGHREPYGWLFLSQGVTSQSVVAVVGEGLYIGAGPSLNHIRVSRDDASGGGQKSVSRRLGLVLHVGLRVPARKRFLFSVTAQYHLMGSAGVGPYTVAYTLGGDSTTTMPRTRASFSYGTIRGGFGVAF